MMPKKTSPGQPFNFSASFYNKLVDTVKWTESQKRLSGAGQTGMRNGPTTLLIKNSTGGAISQFACLEIVGKFGTAVDFANLKVLNGALPSTDLPRPVCIVQAPAEDGELVEAVVVGATMAIVNVTSLSHQYAEPQAGSEQLVSASLGRYRMLSTPSGTGVQNLLVRMEAAERRNSILIQAPADGIPGRYRYTLGKATCTVVPQDLDGDLTTGDDSDIYFPENPEQVEVWNWTTQPACTLGWRLGVANWVNDRWYIVAEDCSDEGSEISPITTGGGMGDPTNPIDSSGGGFSTSGGLGTVSGLVTGIGIE